MKRIFLSLESEGIRNIKYSRTIKVHRVLSTEDSDEEIEYILCTNQGTIEYMKKMDVNEAKYS
jgi:hypothetical protein